MLAAVAMCSGGKDSPEDAAKKAANKEAGFHCLSGWDGSHRDFVAKVKSQLRDPGSFEHYETRVGPNRNGRHSITMEFGAKNGFGGMNRDIAMGSYEHETCVPSAPVIVGN
jgi:methylmalonyl-CoA mutase cobalamin-binding subunit